jgi:hypothetical protein
VPCTIIGSLMEVVWLTNSESLVLRRRAICDLTPKDVVVGVGSFDFAVLCDFKRDGALCVF